MKRKLISLVLALILLFSLQNVALAASSAETVTLSLSSAKAQAGDNIILSGTAPADSYISIKGVDSDGNILYFHAVMSDHIGAYSDGLKVPAMADGTLTLVAGSGSNTASAQLIVYTASGSPDTNSSDSSSGGATTTYTADVKVSGIKTNTLPVTVSGSIGSAELTATKATELFSTENAVISMPTISGVSSYTLRLPATSLSVSQGSGALTLLTSIGSVTLPANMLSSLTGLGGKTAGITITAGDTLGLTDAEKAAVGNRPVIQLTLTVDGTQVDWNNPDAPDTVSIPYAPTAAELANPDSIVVWYIDGSGTLVCVPNGHYDAARSTVTFTTTHFSTYAVGYNKVSFTDVADTAWYADAVTYLAARGVTTGTTATTFSPDATLTRGQFITLLLKAYGVAAVTNAADNFSDAGDTYYTGYLAAAKQLDITTGVGGNLFIPEKAITRQEMFTLLYNALKELNQLPDGATNKTLADFSDAEQVASWAKDAMSALVKAGTVSGSNGKLTPTSTTTRVEMAQVLYNLLGK